MPAQRSSRRQRGAQHLEDDGISPSYPEDSLCFYDALKQLRDDQISSDTYLRAITAHCTGLRHGDNGLCNNNTARHAASSRKFASNITSDLDYFTDQMVEWILKDVCRKQRRVQDVEPIFKALRAYWNNDGQIFGEAIIEMDETYPEKSRAKKQDKLSRTLCLRLTLAGLQQDRDSIMRVICLDEDRRRDIRKCEEFHRVYELAGGRERSKMTVEVIRDTGADREPGLKWGDG